MKRARVWLLLFLAVLLPVRGAVAATMLCSMAPPVQHEQMLHAEGHGEHHHHESATPAADKCNLCAASCGLTPLPSQPPSVAAPPEGTAERFPEISAPPVSFLSDGQERPPRSI